MCELGSSVLIARKRRFEPSFSKVDSSDCGKTDFRGQTTVLEFQDCFKKGRYEMITNPQNYESRLSPRLN